MCFDRYQLPDFTDGSPIYAQRDSGLIVPAQFELPAGSAPQAEVSRRTFLKLMGASLALAGLAGCASAGSSEAATAMPAQADPLAFIRAESDANANVDNLFNYRNFKPYLQAVYQLFVARTGRGDAAHLTAISSLGNNDAIARAFAADTLHTAAGVDPFAVHGKTYGLDGQKNELKIIYNAQSPIFQRDILRDPANKQRYPWLPDRILDSFLPTALHEPYHAVTPVTAIAEAFVSSSGTNYNYDYAWGMGLLGEAAGQRAANFGQVDELTVFWLLKQQFGDIEFVNRQDEIPQEAQDIGMKLFAKLGYETATQVLELRDPGRGSLEVISRIAARHGNDKNTAFAKYVIYGNIIFAVIQGQPNATQDLERFIEEEIPAT